MSNARPGTTHALSLASGAPGSRHMFNAAAAQPDELRSSTERLLREPATAEGASEVDRDLERQWYDDLEGGGHGDAFDPFSGDDASFAKREVELQKRFTRRDGSLMTLAQSKRVSQVNADRNAWEENRLVTSGVARLREVDLVRGVRVFPGDFLAQAVSLRRVGGAPCLPGPRTRRGDARDAAGP